MDPSDYTIAAAPGPAGKSRLVIFLDELHLTLRSRHLVLARLQEVLEGELPQGTEIMLAAYTGSVEVVSPFTDDRKSVIKQLGERFAGSARPTANSLETRSLMRQLPPNHH